MSFDPLSALFDLGKTAIEKIWPDPSKRAEELFRLEQLKQAGDLARMDAEVKLLLGQIEINKVEAQHPSIFIAGWRPFAGWCGVLRLLMRLLSNLLRDSLQKSDMVIKATFQR